MRRPLQGICFRYGVPPQKQPPASEKLTAVCCLVPHSQKKPGTGEGIYSSVTEKLAFRRISAALTPRVTSKSPGSTRHT